jgi:tetratricopeptide (TPR) repeat protein
MVYGTFLAAMGRADEALDETERALELDPLSPATISGVGFVLQMARRDHEAERRYREALDLDPNFGYGRWSLGRVLSAQGQHAPAAIELQKAITLTGGSPDEVAALASAYAVAGRKAEALETLATLQALSRDRYVSPTIRASVYASLGDRDRAFAWLDRAFAERDFLLVTVRVEPMFDPLRRDPRFTELLTRMNLGP